MTSRQRRTKVDVGDQSKQRRTNIRQLPIKSLKQIQALTFPTKSCVLVSLGARIPSVNVDELAPKPDCEPPQKPCADPFPKPFAPPPPPKPDARMPSGKLGPREGAGE